jgi:hypothetical protein
MISGEAAPPISRLFISTARAIAIATRRTPIASVPRPSKSGLPVMIARATPAVAKNSPMSAPESSSSRTGSSGLREVRM